ncbi:ACP S-malonyltransferase [Radiobacillus sp. PE A8.2]|uniref:ACP S-malonyltransferase n=1 Tax=Radiobacillus sp. PE A8.2 TaxID=3380349 RepID=UPI003890C8B0
MKRVAFVFPGQGSQAIGMGKAMYDTYEEVQEIFEKANQLLKTDITALMFEGPADELTNTVNAQPALLLTSVAINHILRQQGVEPVITAGHSLGEYSALVAAGSLSLDDALPLVQKRGQLMESAYPKGQGAMAAVLGSELAVIEEVIQDINNTSTETVDIANLNCPGQVVISGTKQGIEIAQEKLAEKGAKRVIPLNVSGPFHSRLMEPAAEQFREALENVSIRDAKVPVVANVTAQTVTEQIDIPDLLVKQLYSPVRFEEIIEEIIQSNVDAIVEVGNGKVLNGLVKKVNRRMKTFAIQDPASLSEFMEWYKEES